MINYNDTILKVQELLTLNDEWKERYKKYSEIIDKKTNNEIFKKAQHSFSVPSPFHLYMPLSMLVNTCSNRRTAFELRFHGKSVAEIYVKNSENRKVSLKVLYPRDVVSALINAGMEKEAAELKRISEGGITDWDTSNNDARLFRKIYADLEEKVNNGNVRLSGQPEHDMESYLLQNYSQKSSADKEIKCGIQPVTMYNTRARFQMPTPICASNVKKGVHTLSYSYHNGGGIDILARVGVGFRTRLAVIELKDENNKNEPPELAINQAIAYATFLRELLRSESGKDWWKLFGFENKKTSSPIEIMAVIVMPNKNNPDTSFGGKVLSFDGSDDTITLHYIYRPENGSSLLTDI